MEYLTDKVMTVMFMMSIILITILMILSIICYTANKFRLVQGDRV